MSDTLPETPRFQSQLDSWDANKAKHEAEQWEDSLLRDKETGQVAGVDNFSSDEARQRFDEAATYNKYMEQFAGESDGDLLARSLDRANAIEEINDEGDPIDRAINSTPELHKMDLLAGQIAKLRAEEVSKTGKEAESVKALRVKFEDMLNEMMLSYPFDKDNTSDNLIFGRIADRTVAGSDTAESTSGSEHPTLEDDDSSEADDPTAIIDSRTGDAETSTEGTPESSEGESDEQTDLDPELDDIINRLDEVEVGDADATAEVESSLSDAERECMHVLGMSRDEYARLTADDRENIWGRLFRDNSRVSRVMQNVPGVVDFLDRLGGRQDFIDELEQARTTYENNIKEYLALVEARLDTEGRTEEQKQQVLTLTLLAQDQMFEQSIVNNQAEQSLPATKMSNWWVRQNGLLGNIKKAGAVFGGALVVGGLVGSGVGALIGAGSATAYAGIAAGAVFGVNRAKYITDRRANSEVVKGSGITVAELTSQISSDRKSDIVETRMNQFGTAESAIEDMIDETENITDEEVLRNRMRTRRMASIAMLAGGIAGGAAGDIVGNALHPQPGVTHAPSSTETQSPSNHGGGGTQSGVETASGSHSYEISHGEAPETLLKQLAPDQLGTKLSDGEAYRLINDLHSQFGSDVFDGLSTSLHSAGNVWINNGAGAHTNGLSGEVLKTAKQLVASYRQ